jgi:hypothetical protein
LFYLRKSAFYRLNLFFEALFLPVRQYVNNRFVEIYLGAVEQTAYKKLLQIAAGASRIMYNLEGVPASIGTDRLVPERGVSVYSTVADGKITIVTDHAASVKVLDSKGKTTAVGSCGAGETKIRLNGENGLYLVLVNNGTTSSVHKVLLSKK